jgi:hypothetical protein
MLMRALTAFVLACMAIVIQATSEPVTQGSLPTEQTLNVSKTPSGCLTNDANAATRWLWQNSEAPSIAWPGRLGRTDFHWSLGGVRIVTGLVPSTDVAARAGALDPTDPAVLSASSRIAPGGGAPLVARDSSVRLADGSCR